MEFEGLPRGASFTVVSAGKAAGRREALRRVKRARH